MQEPDAGQDNTKVVMSRSGVRGFSPAALRRRRAEAGLTLRELAVVSGVGAQTLRAWEAGRTYPSPHKLAAVAKALRLPIADLLTVDEADLRLSDLRFRCGLTQADVAAALATSISAVSAIESGFRSPTDAQITLLAEVYGLTERGVRAVADHTLAALLRRLEAR